MSAAGERGPTARKYGRTPSDTLASGKRAEKPTLREQVSALTLDVAALIQANMGRAALIDDLADRMARVDCEIVKLKGQLSALTGRVVLLESGLDACILHLEKSPSSEPADYALGLAKLSDKIDQSNPDRVAGNSVAELAKRAANRK